MHTVPVPSQHRRAHPPAPGRAGLSVATDEIRLVPGGAPPGRGAPPQDDPRVLLRRYRRWAIALDVVWAFLAVAGAVSVRFGDWGSGAYRLAPVAAPVLWVAAAAVYRAYEPRFLGYGPEEIRRILHAGVLVFAGIAVCSYASSGQVSRSIVLFGVPATVAASLTSRWALRAWLARQRVHGRGLNRVLVVGDVESVGGLVAQLRRHPSHGFETVGICIPRTDPQPSHIGDVPVLGDVGSFLDVVD